jgi:hypothetical protein
MRDERMIKEMIKDDEGAKRNKRMMKREKERSRTKDDERDDQGQKNIERGDQ